MEINARNQNMSANSDQGNTNISVKPNSANKSMSAQLKQEGENMSDNTDSGNKTVSYSKINTFSISINTSGKKNKVALPANASKKEAAIAFAPFNKSEFWKIEQMSVEQLLQHIKHGFAWMPSTISGDRNKGNVISSELLVFDFDDAARIEDYLTNEFVQRYALALHTSASHTEKNHKFRLIFRLPKPLTSVEEIESLNALAFAAFPECDQQTKDSTRFFYGNENAQVLLCQSDAVLPENYEQLFAEMVHENLAAEFNMLNSAEKTKRLKTSAEASLDFFEFKARFTLPCDTAMPLENFVTKAHRALIADGASNGGRNSQGYALACDLIGVAQYFESIGQSYAGSPQDLFFQYCQRCPSDGWSVGEWETIFASAEKRTSGAALSEEAINNIALSFVWKNKKQQTGTTNRQLAQKQQTGESAVKKLGTSANAVLLTLSQTEEQVRRIAESELEIWEKRHEYNQILQRSVCDKQTLDLMIQRISDTEEIRQEIQLGLKDSLTLPSVSLHDVLPNALADYMVDDAKKLSIDPIMLIHTFLPAVASLLPMDSTLDMKGAKFPAVLWNLIVGKSGIGKTRAFNLINDPIKVLQLNEHKRYKEAQKAWAETEREAKQAGETLDDSERPVERKYLLGSSTIEGKFRALAQQTTHGTLHFQDELIGAIKAQGQYSQNKANPDQEHEIEIYEGGYISLGRSDESRSSFLEKPRMSKVGGTQNEIWRSLFGDLNDAQGVNARFLTVVPKMIISRPVPAYCALAELLPTLYPQFERLALSNVKPTNEAFDLYSDIVFEYKKNSRKANPMMEKWLNKAPAHVGRLSLVLHAIECVFDQSKQTQILTAGTVKRAYTYLEYCRQSLAYLQRSQSPVVDMTAVMVKIINLAEQMEGVTAREVVMNVSKFKQLAKEMNRKASELATDIFKELMCEGKGSLKKEGRTQRFYVSLRPEEQTYEIQSSSSELSTSIGVDEIHNSSIEDSSSTVFCDSSKNSVPVDETPPIEEDLADALVLSAVEALQTGRQAWLDFKSALSEAFDGSVLKQVITMLCTRAANLFQIQLDFV